MKQNLTELIYLREEEAMNLELSLNMVNTMKRYWKEFKNYCLAKDISYFDNNQIHLYLKDNYNCLLINNTNNLSKKQKEVIKAMLLLIDINNISKYTVITYKDIPLNDYYMNILNNYLDFWQNIKNNSESTIKKKKIFTILFFNYLIDNNIYDLKELNNFEYLFMGNKHSKCSTKMITHIVDKYAEISKINKNIHPHVFRHTRAMHMIEADIPLVYIRDILGHKEISTTEIYAKVNVETKRKALENVYNINNNFNNETTSWNKNEELIKSLLELD